MLRRLVRLLGLVVMLSTLSAGSALAAKGGAGTETFTEHSHEVLLFSFPIENQCTGAAGSFSAIAANEVFHSTMQADGNLWVTGTAEGTATFVPFEEGVSYSGHFVNWFGEAINQRNHIEHATTTYALTGTDGSQVVIHMSSHLSTNANGVVTVETEDKSFHCI